MQECGLLTSGCTTNCLQILLCSYTPPLPMSLFLFLSLDEAMTQDLREAIVSAHRHASRNEQDLLGPFLFQLLSQLLGTGTHVCALYSVQDKDLDTGQKVEGYSSRA